MYFIEENYHDFLQNDDSLKIKDKIFFSKIKLSSYWFAEGYAPILKNLFSFWYIYLTYEVESDKNHDKNGILAQILLPFPSGSNAPLIEYTQGC